MDKQYNLYPLTPLFPRLALHRYLSPTFIESMTVDNLPAERLKMNFDISFHNLRCSECVLDVMDVSGEHIEDVSTGLRRQRLDPSGVPIGPPSSIPILSTQDQAQEGCRLFGYVEVKKVAGNLHLAVGGSTHHEKNEKHVHKFKLRQMKAFNASHTIHSFHFGNYLSLGHKVSLPEEYLELLPPPKDFFEPSSGKVVNVQSSRLINFSNRTPDAIAHYQYFFKAVPTTYYEASDDKEHHTYQYAVTSRTVTIDPSHPTQAEGLPGVFFIYDFSPFRMNIYEEKKRLTGLLTSICAIIGGAFFLVGFFDSAVYYIQKSLLERKRYAYQPVPQQTTDDESNFEPVLNPLPPSLPRSSFQDDYRL